MIHDGYVKGAPLVQYPDTEANIEAIAAPVAGMLAYASDTGAMGRYDGVAAAWVWGSAGDDHNDLAGLQGGVASEYYHLTSTQHTAVAAMVTAGLSALTSAEVNQLENIGAVTISNAQWGYLGAADQGTATGDSPTFADVFVPDGGTFGIAGNELLTVNAAETFAFSGVTGIVVEADLNGLTRSYITNVNAGANRRQDIRIGMGAGTEAIYLGLDAATVLGIGTAYLDNRSGGAFSYFYAGAEQVTILTSGNIGINEPAPGAKVHITGDGVSSLLVCEKSGGGNALLVTDTGQLRGHSTGYTYYQIAQGNFHHKWHTRTNAGAALERFTIEGGALVADAYFQNCNVGIGTTVFGANADTVLGIANGTQPTTSPANMIQLFSMDIAGGVASVGIRTEETVTAGAPTPSHKVKIKWNGVEYWLSLDAV